MQNPNRQIQRPVGLNAFCDAVEAVCENAALYRRIGPMHFTVQLDPGSGRTTALEYMTDRYRDCGVLPFASGPDDFVEVTLDASTPEAVRRSFAAFEEAAIYEARYGNVAALDAADAARHLGEPPFQTFLQAAGRLCETAWTVFFVPARPDGEEEQLLQALEARIRWVQRIAAPPYTRQELCLILERQLRAFGIGIQGYPGFHAALLDFVKEAGLDGVQDTATAARALAHYADFARFVPSIGPEAVHALAASRRRAGGKEAAR